MGLLATPEPELQFLTEPGAEVSHIRCERYSWMESQFALCTPRLMSAMQRTPEPLRPICPACAREAVLDAMGIYRPLV